VTTVNGHGTSRKTASRRSLEPKRALFLPIDCSEFEGARLVSHRVTSATDNGDAANSFLTAISSIFPPDWRRTSNYRRTIARPIEEDSCSCAGLRGRMVSALEVSSPADNWMADLVEADGPLPASKKPRKDCAQAVPACELFMSKKGPHQTDRYVGARVRMRRNMLGMTQTGLADVLGVTFQQVQKYEKGTNRISASRLQHIAAILQVPVTFFFEGGPSEQLGTPGATHAYVAEFLARPDGLTLARSFVAIKNDMLRRAIVRFVQQISEADLNETAQPMHAVDETLF
jgi:transcriptional regulator with XRE-family HTH domain